MSSAIQGKLQKSLDRFKERIEKGSYYEAQQTIRAITNRYVNSKNYELAIELLYQSSMILMEYKKFDESCDLIDYLTETVDLVVSNGINGEKKDVDYIKREYISKLINLVVVIPDSDPNLLVITKDLIRWSQKITGDHVGFKNLNYALGEKLLHSDEGDIDTLRLSELLLLLSHDEKNSLELLTNLEFQLYLKDSDVNSAGYYISRLVLPYLILGNIKYAQSSMETMLKKLVESKRIATLQFNDKSIIESDSASLNLINFLNLLIFTVERSNKENFRNFTLLFNRYKDTLQELELVMLVNQISVKYFDNSIIEKQSNLIQDMMSGLLGGGKKR